MYGQHEVVKDLVRARLEAGGQVLFEAEGVDVQGADAEEPAILYRKDGEDYVLSCDGFYGVCRPSIP